MFVDDAWLAQVRAVLQQCGIALEDVFAFGSRVHGRNLKPFSDLDLCIRGDARVAREAMSKLARVFADSDLPINIDVIDWHATNSEFQNAIRDDLTPSFPRSDLT